MVDVSMNAWHDIIKDPTDVPDSYRDVLVTSYVGDDGVPTPYVYIAQYRPDKKNWSNCDSDIIVAWMECPKPYPFRENL